LVYFGAVWYGFILVYFSRFGMFAPKKSGNLGPLFQITPGQLERISFFVSPIRLPTNPNVSQGYEKTFILPSEVKAKSFQLSETTSRQQQRDFEHVWKSIAFHSLHTSICYMSITRH
jgi:hypothetical protein